MTSDRLIFRQDVLGSRRFSNYWWAAVSAMGGIGFLFSGTFELFTHQSTHC